MIDMYEKGIVNVKCNVKSSWSTLSYLEIVHAMLASVGPGQRLGSKSIGLVSYSLTKTFSSSLVSSTIPVQ